MRVMCLFDATINDLVVFEIKEIGFDDDIFDIKDENGEYDRYAEKLTSGLYMIDYEGQYFYIEGVSQTKCNHIFQEVLTTGFYDLSKLGECNSYE